MTKDLIPAAAADITYKGWLRAKVYWAWHFSLPSFALFRTYGWWHAGVEKEELVVVCATTLRGSKCLARQTHPNMGWQIKSSHTENAFKFHCFTYSNFKTASGEQLFSKREKIFPQFSTLSASIPEFSNLLVQRWVSNFAIQYAQPRNVFASFSTTNPAHLMEDWSMKYSAFLCFVRSWDCCSEIQTRNPVQRRGGCLACNEQRQERVDVLIHLRGSACESCHLTSFTWLNLSSYF